MNFMTGFIIFLVIACILYGALLSLARRRDWATNRICAYEGVLFLVCGLISALAYNYEMDIPNTLISTVLAPIVIGVFAYFQTAFFYVRLQQYGKRKPGEEIKHKAGKPQYDRERRRRSRFRRK